MTEKIKIIKTKKKERQLRCFYCDRTFIIDRDWTVFYCPYCTKVNTLPDILKDKSIKYIIPVNNGLYQDTDNNIPKNNLSKCSNCGYDNRGYEESSNYSCNRCYIDYDQAKQSLYSSSEEEEIIVVKSPKKPPKLVFIEESETDEYSYRCPKLPNIYRIENYINQVYRNPLYNSLIPQYPKKVIYDPEIDLLRRYELENIYEKEKWKNLYKQKKELVKLKKEVINSKLEAFKNISKSSNFERHSDKRPYI